VAEKLRHFYPEIKVIFMSGHSGCVLSETDKLDPSMVYLQKPFTLAQLVAFLQQANASTV
jgi:hypothetical protein